MLSHYSLKPEIPSRTVIIGAGGFVGGAIMARLRAAGASFLGLTRDQVDLLSTDAVAKLSKLFRAGDAVVVACAIAPCKNMKMLRENIIIAEVIIEALKGSAVSHIINVSSDAVYCDDPMPLTESSLTAPSSLHGVMHLAREISFANELAMPLATLRPTLIYGTADPHNGYGPNRFRRLAKKNEPIVLFGDGEEQRDHVYIDDVAELIFRVLCHKSEGTLNIATGQVASFRNIAEQTIAIFGSSSLIKRVARVGQMPHNGYRAFSTIACENAFPDFNYIHIDEGLRKSLDEAGKS